MFAQAVERGCGSRKAGGVYIDMGLVPAETPGAKPVEDFLVDPPIRVPRQLGADLGVKPIGVSLIEKDGETHVLDWVGAQHYPNVADFVEEVKRFGLSRRCELTSEEYGRLTPNSTLILIHSRAWINAWGAAMRRAYDQDAILLYGVPICPKSIHTLDASLDEMCAGLWWHDLVEGKFQVDGYFRDMPSFAYYGQSAGEEIENGGHTPAIFATFPVQQLVVVKDNESDADEKAFSRASQSSLNVYMVEK